MVLLAAGALHMPAAGHAKATLCKGGAGFKLPCTQAVRHGVRVAAHMQPAAMR
eukprot:NODE_5391_length_585_cov_283.022642.p5 GENE.NODE_5391_length_585_cov_283.022642~~NODE_5391_length_585_cov_283.022642.p5  ORF type:complete len:53 (-),score=13.84 NODE_5391_length_585_cov_283.022642:139-297(-)